MDTYKEETDLNVEFFWSSMQSDEMYNKHATSLIFERNVYLSESGVGGNRDEYDEVVVIGLNPHNRFNVCAYIESRTLSRCLPLDANALRELLDCVDERFGENAIIPKINRYVHIRELEKGIYRIDVGGDHIKMGLKALLVMRNKREIIKSYVRMLECVDYKPALYKLLNHLCFRGKEKTVLQMLHRLDDVNRKQLIEELCALQCLCIDNALVVEIVNNCLEWLVMCVSLFIKTLIHSQYKV